MKLPASLALALLAASLGGCNQTSREAHNAILAYDAGDYAQAAAIIRPKTTKLDENYVLNNCRYGSASIAAGQFDEAETAFYDAYKVINSGDTNDTGRQLTASIVYEGVKVWKGEPFERAMADYYLGVIYFMKHDYGNARAAFQNSIFSLRQNASKDDLEHYEAVQSRFALGYFCLGYCNLRLLPPRPDLAKQNFDLAVKYDPGLAPLVAEVQRPGVNTLIFVDAGRGPRKAARGWYNEESAFGPTPQEVGPIAPVVALIDGRKAVRDNINYSTVDTLAMAQDRRWMDIDTIKKVKALLGTGAVAAGAGMTGYGAANHDEGLMWAGLGTMAVGALLIGSSQSDTRYWETLPRTVYIIPATLAPGPHEVVVSAGPSHSRPVNMTATPPAPGTQGDYIFYFRLH